MYYEDRLVGPRLRPRDSGRRDTRARRRRAAPRARAARSKIGSRVRVEAVVSATLATFSDRIAAIARSWSTTWRRWSASSRGSRPHDACEPTSRRGRSTTSAPCRPSWAWPRSLVVVVTIFNMTRLWSLTARDRRLVAEAAGRRGARRRPSRRYGAGPIERGRRAHRGDCRAGARGQPGDRPPRLLVDRAVQRARDRAAARRAHRRRHPAHRHGPDS